MPGKIPTHRPSGQAQASKSYERQPSRRNDIAFYQSRVWRAVRAVKLASDPLCQQCLKEGRLTPATEVHHVVERKREPVRALDLSNLESLCTSCHNSKRGQTCG